MTECTDSNSPFLSHWWLLFAVLVLAVPIIELSRYSEPPEDYGPVQNFQLIKQDNAIFELSSAGHPLVVNFIFTRCQNICPTLTAKMARLQEELSKDDAIFLSITVDPKHDVPEVLTAYANQFSADLSRWYFLTGEEEKVSQVINSFQQTYELINVDESAPNIMHSEKFILLDKDAHIRGFFDDDPKGFNQLIRSISAL